MRLHTAAGVGECDTGTRGGTALKYDGALVRIGQLGAVLAVEEEDLGVGACGEEVRAGGRKLDILHQLGVRYLARHEKQCRS